MVIFVSFVFYIVVLLDVVYWEGIMLIIVVMIEEVCVVGFVIKLFVVCECIEVNGVELIFVCVYLVFVLILYLFVFVYGVNNVVFVEVEVVGFLMFYGVGVGGV